MTLDEMMPTFCPTCLSQLFTNEEHKRLTLQIESVTECPTCHTRFHFSPVWYVFSQEDYDAVSDFLKGQQ